MSKRKNEKGQAMVEFLMVALVVFFFLFFFLSLAMTLVVSSYMDYVTFMTARTYKSMYSSQVRQEQFARAEFNKYVERIDTVARNFELNFIQAQPGDEQTWGVQASYDVDLFYLPPLFVGEALPSVIRLTSEAYLGRDSSNEECKQFFRNFASRFGLGIESNNNLVEQMADNGC